MKRLALLTVWAVVLAGTASAQTDQDAYLQDLRRVVTGHSAEGKAVVVTDGAPPEVITFESLPGLELVPLWATAQGQEIPGDGEAPAGTIEQFVPGPGETRFNLFRLPSQTEVAAAMEGGTTVEAFHREYAAKVPSLARASDPENPALHATETIDYVIVLSGTVELELDDGVRVPLQEGDVVVQNGTVHAWHNVGEGGAVLAAVMVGSQR